MSSADAGCPVCQLFVHAATESIGNFSSWVSSTGTPLAKAMKDWFPTELAFRIKASLPGEQSSSHLFAVHVERDCGDRSAVVEYFGETTLGKFLVIFYRTSRQYHV